jgi:hypothetical protein
VPAKISKCLSGWGLCFFYSSRGCSFLPRHSRDIPRNSVFDLPFACCPRAREPGSAPPNRRASAIREKTPEIDLRGPPVVDLSLPPLVRLAPGGGHRQPRNGPGNFSWGAPRIQGELLKDLPGLIYHQRAQWNDFWLRGSTRTSFLTITGSPVG